ncbi:MAG: ABC transporter ATP-binding protein, partial [Lentisphaerae bacterium]
IDVPVKNYSSGMYARLGFAIIASLEMDIMLVDEILSVGDEAFSQKCLERMRRFQEAGRTILFVSHSEQAVREFCNRACLLEKGRLVCSGDPGDVFAEYHRRMAAQH